MELSNKEIEKLTNLYGKFWYKKFFLLDHLELSFNLIEKTPQKKKDIEKKFGKDWLTENKNLELLSEKDDVQL